MNTMTKQQSKRASKTFSASFVGREYEPPPRALVRTTTHELTVGMRCEHRSIPGDRWTITYVGSFWCRASRGGGKHVVEQAFPCDVMVPIAKVVHTPRPKPATATPDAKKEIHHVARDTIRDDVALRLAEADTLDELWALATALGLPADLRQRLSHLNPGLQRMNIGNRLRGLAKKQAAAQPKKGRRS